MKKTILSTLIFLLGATLALGAERIEPREDRQADGPTRTQVTSAAKPQLRTSPAAGRLMSRSTNADSARVSPLSRRDGRFPCGAFWSGTTTPRQAHRCR